MKLFDFFKRKKTFSDEEVEREYQKAQKKVQEVDSSIASFVRDIKKYAENTCQPHEGDDVLAQKAEFIRIYAFRARQWHYYHVLGYKKGRLGSYPLWTQKWHNYEQAKRLQASKRWCEIQSHTR